MRRKLENMTEEELRCLLTRMKQNTRLPEHMQREMSSEDESPDKKLIRYARNGNINGLKELLNNNGNEINFNHRHVSDPEGNPTLFENTALLWTVANCNTECALLLIGQKEVDIGLQDNDEGYKNSPLHLAIMKGRNRTVQYGNTLEMKGMKEMQGKEIERGDVPMGKVIDRLILRAIEDRKKDSLNAKAVGDKTPAHLAYLCGDIGTLTLLLAAGARIDINSETLYAPSKLYAEFKCCKCSTFLDSKLWSQNREAMDKMITQQKNNASSVEENDEATLKKAEETVREMIEERERTGYYDPPLETSLCPFSCGIQ